MRSDLTSAPAQRDPEQLDRVQRDQLNVGGAHCDDLGPEARAELRSKIQELKEEMQDAEKMGHEGRYAEAKNHLDALVEQLNRERPTRVRQCRAIPADPREKARKAVYKTITSAIKAIREAGMPSLADHLDNCIKTGWTCQYSPINPQIPWQF
jgi:hypothetical protein